MPNLANPQSGTTLVSDGSGLLTTDSPQLPASLGQKTAANSLAVVPASDHPISRAASFRAALRGEILPINVTNASKRFAVPAGWLGKLVRVHADGGDVYYQISTSGTGAACDLGARAVEGADGSGNITLSPSAAGTGCVPIKDGAWLDIPFPADAQTFALITSNTGGAVARAHPSET